MADFVKKLRSGETPSDAEWTNLMIEIHRQDPGFTPRAFAGLKTIHGQNSYAALAEVLTETKPLQVLDLACGDGHLLPFVEKRLAPGSKITGTDISPEELSQARLRFPHLEFIEAPAQTLPFTDQKFDIILCHLALMLILPLEPVALEIQRILKPGGRFAAVVAAPPDDDFFFEIQKIIGDFLKSRFPGRAQARTGDPRATTAAGWRHLFPNFIHVQERDLTMEVDTNPQGVWNLLEGMYFVRFLSGEEKEELREVVLKHSSQRARLGRHLHFEFPLRLIQATKPS